MKRVTLVVALLLILVSCDDGGAVATTEEPATTQTSAPSASVPPTTTAASSTVVPSTTVAPTTAPSTSTMPTTIPPQGVTIEGIVAEVQSRLDERFNSGEAPEGVIGPVRVTCDDTGQVRAGDVFACTGVPQTDPGFELDSPGMVFAVLDEAGLVAWSTGTDLPTSTDRLLEAYRSVPSGLHCRDLADPDRDDLSIFAASGSTPQYGYFWSLVYWFLEGSPTRMDADGNGIPCETRYDAGIVSSVWDGGDIEW